MQKAKQRDKPIVHEAHHIIPKSLGGSNDKDNIAFLSPREHFISHALLTKMVVNKKHKRSMAYAFARMKVSNNKSKYKRIGNGKLYESISKNLRELYSGENNPFYGDQRFRGKNNPFYGKTHTEETKDKIRQQKKKMGKDNHFFGKKHSSNTKSIISNKQKESVTIIFEDGNMIKFDKKSDIGPKLGLSKAMGIQLCSIKRHLWSKYKIKEILHENNINQKGSN